MPIFTYQAKYGVRDYKGGGRSSARETAARVAAGAIARKIIPGVSIKGALIQMGPHKIDRTNWDWTEVDRNPFFTPDARAAKFYEEYLDGVRKSGSSCGAIIEVTASGVPAGWGAPIYGKLDQDLAAAMMSINAVKGVEIGAGFASAALSWRAECGRDPHASRQAGIPLQQCGRHSGGISTGQDVVVRFAVKPTSSILSLRKTVTAAGEETDVMTKAATTPASASAPCRSAKP